MEQSSKNSVADLFSGSSYQFNTSRWKENNSCGLPIVTDAYNLSSDASLFSTSLPILQHEKFNFTELGQIVRSSDGGLHNLNKLCLEEVRDSLEDVELSKLGIFLPGDEDGLYAGPEDDFDLNGLPTRVEDLDDDLFGSGGGIEIESDNQENLANGVSRLSSSTSGISGNTNVHNGFTNAVRTFSGEHPSGEHPSRTLFVRNINSHVDDSELKFLFEQYGDIREIYTACKQRGFVMISYYDIRDAHKAMSSLQNRLLRGRNLDIHFSIPKNNPSEKDLNHGTLVVFNLDASVSKDKLLKIFGAYGEVKEIRETPHKQNHKFIEFHDVRAAEAALKALNRCEIAGKRIKLEPSRPGGARQSLIQRLSRVQDQVEGRASRHQVGSPILISSPGAWPYFGSPVEHNPLYSCDQSSNFRSLSPVGSNQSSGSASLLLSRVSNPVKIAPIGKDTGRIGHLDQDHSSYPSTKFSISPGPTSPFSDSLPSSDGTLSGSEFLWGSPTVQSELINSSARSPSSKGHPLPSSGHGTSFLYTSQHGSFLGSHLHVGSAPSGFKLERHFGFPPESPGTSSLNQGVFGATDFRCNNRCLVRNITGPVNLGGTSTGYFTQSASPSSRMPWTSRNGSAYFRDSSFGCKGATSNDEITNCFRIGRIVSDVQLEIRKQYQLDLEKIVKGEDNRTTLMIKNIPNKYTSKMLIAAIDEMQEVIYDFIYLPIDFKNKCNVGYAFINMVSPSHIITFYKAFNGKKWEKFNSEKVASLAYARIQGLAALISNFQNSTLMNEDRRCRPIIFKSECQGTGDVEHFPPGNLNILIRQPDGSYTGDFLDSPKGDPDSQ
ncbi:protein MEI2-like 2 isoform X1 [Primulina huaijiensis]|uniref:protein MEI2-like 2 isoform X1 n=1 Tax=Primulina huaijiensis TaxID=1492673 RepID=UPI003CC6F1EA